MIWWALISLWVASGFIGFVIRWTRDFDLDVAEAFLGVMAALIFGPLTYLIVSLSWSDNDPMVILRKRGDK